MPPSSASKKRCARAAELRIDRTYAVVRQEPELSVWTHVGQASLDDASFKGFKREILTAQPHIEMGVFFERQRFVLAQQLQRKEPHIVDHDGLPRHARGRLTFSVLLGMWPSS